MENKLYDNFVQLSTLLQQNPQTIQEITAIIANPQDKQLFTELPKTKLVENDEVFCEYDGIPVILNEECPKQIIYALYKGTKNLSDETVYITEKSIWKWHDGVKQYITAS